MSGRDRRETWVGRSIRRVEDFSLVTGRGRFTADLTAAQWVRFVRSPVAAGRIESITAPQGATVITAADLAGVKPIRPMLHKFGYVPIDQPVLASDVVRFVGEPIAAVIAASEEEAEDLADGVEVVIADSMAVVRAEDALAAGAVLVHNGVPGNVIVEARHATPDFNAARKAAYRLISVEIRSRRQNAMPLEARGGHAAYDPASGRIFFTCSTQTPHLMRTAIADLENRGLTPILDATPAGRAVYSGEGFTDRWGFKRFFLSEKKPAPLPRSSVRPVRESDWKEILAMDLQAFGASREGMLRTLHTRQPQAALIVEGEGFVFGREGREARQIGPLIARNADTARLLLGEALRAIEAPVYVDVPDHSALEAWVEALGFTFQRPYTRMVRGPRAAPGTQELVFLVAGPELG